MKNQSLVIRFKIRLVPVPPAIATTHKAHISASFSNCKKQYLIESKPYLMQQIQSKEEKNDP